MYRFLLAAVFLLALSKPLFGSDSAPEIAPSEAVATHFNPAFLAIDNASDEQLDPSIFTQHNRVLPGEYRVDVSINSMSIGIYDIRLYTPDTNAQADAVPCLTAAMLDEWGVDMQSPAFATAGTGDTCIDVTQHISDARLDFDLDQQHLTVSIPQIAMRRAPRGYVSPEQWDNGETAWLLNYDLNASQTRTQRGSSDAAHTSTVFGSMRTGFNIGHWRLRSTLNARSSDATRALQIHNTYAQRDVTSVRSRLTLGQTNTLGKVFDSVGLTGVQIASDDTMLPDGLQGYAPVIRGIAQTNAKITIRQHGFVIYDAFVAPGPFVIDDLYSALSGDLEVSITEADGRQTRFVQPFTTLPVLVRSGTTRYAAAFGAYRNGQRSNGPLFAETTFVRGLLLLDLTLYGGVQLTGIYQSIAAGIGRNWATLGALSADTTWSRSVAGTNTSKQSPVTGSSFRLLYRKALSSNTSIHVAGTHYARGTFRTLSEVAHDTNDKGGTTFNTTFLRANRHKRKNRVECTIGQHLGRYGSFYVSLAHQTYHTAQMPDFSAQIGYSGNARYFSYGLYYSQSRMSNTRPESQLALTLNIPIGRSSTQSAYASMDFTRNSTNDWHQDARINGSAFDDGRLNYGVSVSRNTSKPLGGSTHLSYRGRYGTAGANFSTGKGYRQVGTHIGGSIVGHRGGFTLGQSLGESMTLVDTNGIGGIHIASYPGVRTDNRGYAVIPNATPYRRNRVALDVGNMPNNVELKDTVTNVVPTRGALVKARFNTTRGIKALLTLQRDNEQPVPFGAQVLNANGEEISIVGDDGEAYVTGLQERGVLTVRWGKSDTRQCTAEYAIEADSDAPLVMGNARCISMPKPIQDPEDKRGTIN